MTERKAWQNCWEEVKFCSDRCKAEAKRAKKQQQQAAAEGGDEP